LKTGDVTINTVKEDESNLEEQKEDTTAAVEEEKPATEGTQIMTEISN
jgi:hypothetical protein